MGYARLMGGSVTGDARLMGGSVTGYARLTGGRQEMRHSIAYPSIDGDDDGHDDVFGDGDDDDDADGDDDGGNEYYFHKSQHSHSQNKRKFTSKWVQPYCMVTPTQAVQH